MESVELQNVAYEYGYAYAHVQCIIWQDWNRCNITSEIYLVQYMKFGYNQHLLGEAWQASNAWNVSPGMEGKSAI